MILLVISFTDGKKYPSHRPPNNSAYTTFREKKQGKCRREKEVIFLFMNFIEQMHKLLHFLEEAD